MSSLRTGFSARDIESAAPALASIPTIALERKSRIARSRRLLRARPRGADTLTVPRVSGRIDEVTCPRIAVLGTECTLDNRTTATVLTRALLEHGIAAIMIGTDGIGSTRDARYGIPFDAVPPPLCAEELEVKIVEAFERERPDVIVVGGQGAPNHPACSSSSFVLLGSRPHGVVLQHAPGRTHRCDFERMAMSSLACEIDLIQTFAGARVVGLTINHESTDDAEIDASIVRYGRELGIPVTDAFARPSDALVEMVLAGLPECRSGRSTPGQFLHRVAGYPVTDARGSRVAAGGPGRVEMHAVAHQRGIVALYGVLETIAEIYEPVIDESGQALIHEASGIGTIKGLLPRIRSAVVAR